VRLEHWWYTLPLRLRSIFRRGRVEAEMAEELQFHLEHMVDEGIAEGLSPEQARRRAMRAMGGLEQRKEEMREARRVAWLLDFAADVGYAFCSLRRAPGLTALVVVTLALGIGMTATPFSMLDALVFRPYPLPEPDRVVSLVGTSRDTQYALFSYREYLDIRDHTASYDGVVASSTVSAVGFASEAQETPRVRGAMLVSGNYFRALGVEPSLGRGFRDDEDEVPGRDAVVVLGHDFWRRELGADPGLVGRTIRINGIDCTVVGVTPESFPGLMLFTNPDLYLPLSMAGAFATDPRKDFFEDRDDRELAVRARLRHGVSLGAARAELGALADGFATAYPKTNRQRGASVHTRLEMRTRSDDIYWKFGLIFTILAVSVLLVACTNVAGLLLSRSRSRSREIAVRLALGSGRLRLIRLLLTESLVLALVGGALGIAIGYLGIDLLRRFTIPADLPVEIPFRMDGRVLVACLAMSLVSAVACGLAPAFATTRSDLARGLKTADVDEPGRKRLWGRNALVVAQVAMSLMLLSAAFLMARSFRATVEEGVGFPMDHLLLARFDPRLARADEVRTARFYDQLAERARRMSGVRNAGLTQSPPMGLDGFASIAFVPQGYEMPADRESFTSEMDVVDEGFFATTGIDIVRGRAFLRSDDAAAPRVAIVNEHFAERFFPRRDAVGQRIRLDGRDGPPAEIVGVARTIKYHEASDRQSDFVYLPLRQNPRQRMVLLLRTAPEPLQVIDGVKRLAHDLEPDLPISELRTYDDLYRYHAVEGPGVAIKLVGTLGGIGLVLAISGLYGLVAYNVSRRTREIGIRMAVGASAGDVLRLMMMRGLLLVAVGTALGLALGFGVERLMKTMLFHTAGIDWTVYAFVVPAMLGATVLAAWIPARRAARIAPTLALRCE